MIDVHPPHAPTHTWRDFFIHVGTICVGLLIAIGLEQTVEAIHHHHQRQELVASVLEDTKRATHDAEGFEQDSDHLTQWTVQRIAEVRNALYLHHPLPAAAPFSSSHPNIPNAPSWAAARSSGLLAVLSQDEVRSLGEGADLALELKPLVIVLQAQRDKAQRFDQHYLVPSTPERYDYSTATPTELREYLDQLLALQTALYRADLWLRYIRGANAAILEGSRNIEDINNAELRFIPQSPTK